jgi:hypothetical protein
MKPPKLLHFLIASSLAWGTINCHKEGSEDAFAVLLSTTPSVISSIEPRVGTPLQANIDRNYSATNVIIKGENFGFTDTKVFFNTVEAPVLYNFGTEISTRVPSGARSGFLYVVKTGGVCTQGTNLGVNCTGTEFFVDCYSPYNKEFGNEIAIDQGSSKNIEFSGEETKAIRIDFPAQSGNVTVDCPAAVTVRYFSPSCDYTSLALVTDPKIPVINSKIMQLLVTANDVTCTISGF